jgi:hypothetical protein
VVGDEGLGVAPLHVVLVLAPESLLELVPVVHLALEVAVVLLRNPCVHDHGDYSAD